MDYVIHKRQRGEKSMTQLHSFYKILILNMGDKNLGVIRERKKNIIKIYYMKYAIYIVYYKKDTHTFIYVILFYVIVPWV